MSKFYSKIDWRMLLITIILLVVAITLLVYSYGYRKIVGDHNTMTYETTLRNVEYRTEVRGCWISFSSDIGECYISPRSIWDVKELAKTIASCDSTIIISTTNQHRPIKYYTEYEQRLHVAKIQSNDRIIYSYEDFNADVILDRVVFTLIAVILIIVSIFIVKFFIINTGVR